MGRLIQDVRNARRNGDLSVHFRAADVAEACPQWASNTFNSFLPKHAVGNPGRETELFVRLAPGLYCLVEEKP